MRLLSNITFLAALLATAVSCGGDDDPNPIQPPPPVSQLQLACPSAIVREATSPQGTDVHFDAPAPTGGQAPYTVACDPGSGSVFPIGETTDRCSAKDANMSQASCDFQVSVRVSKTLAKTKFTAFGDSITEGVVSLAPFIMLGPPDTYPFKLEQMLLQRYPVQPVLVVNEGRAGEDTRQLARRLPSVLNAHNPEVLLLQGGINNINALPTSTQVTAFRTMITDAQAHGAEVIIATLLPMLPSSRQYRSTTPAKIDDLNAQIINLAAQYDLGLVDLFAFFDANQQLMGSDGLHPSAEGQTRIAELFRDEIVRRYDRSSTTSFRPPWRTTGTPRALGVQTRDIIFTP
jgi:lysophospholipase L1-like esterase